MYFWVSHAALRSCCDAVAGDSPCRSPPAPAARSPVAHSRKQAQVSCWVFPYRTVAQSTYTYPATCRFVALQQAAALLPGLRRPPHLQQLLKAGQGGGVVPLQRRCRPARRTAVVWCPESHGTWLRNFASWGAHSPLHRQGPWLLLQDAAEVGASNHGCLRPAALPADRRLHCAGWQEARSQHGSPPQRAAAVLCDLKQCQGRQGWPCVISSLWSRFPASWTWCRGKNGLQSAFVAAKTAS